MMEYQNQLEKLKRDGDGNEGDAKEIAKLENNQTALVRDYLKLAERFGKRTFAQAEAIAGRDRANRIPVSSTEAWADAVDTEEEEEEPFIGVL